VTAEVVDVESEADLLTGFDVTVGVVLVVDLPGT